MAVSKMISRFALAALALTMAVAQESEARGSRRQVAGYEQVTLLELRENPRAYLGKRISFDCFFAGLGGIYQPFQTPFVSDQYLNFYAWEPEAMLWDNKSRRDAFLFNYVPRDLDRQTKFIMRQALYAPVRLYGQVSVVYSGQPWFELEDAEVSPMESYTDLALKHILVGIKSLRNEDFLMAQESFVEALRGGLPNTAQVFVQRELGRTYYELDKYDEAFEALSKVGVTDAWVALKSGQSLSRAADSILDTRARDAKLRDALKLLETARKLEPANATGHAEIGWVRAKLGEPRKGILDCRRALALQQSAGSYRILALIYDQIGRSADAENNYQRAIMLDPSNPKYHADLADLYMKLGKFGEAEAEYTNVVTLTSTEPGGYLARARSRKALGNVDGVLSDFEEALRQDSENLDALLGMAATHRDSGQYEQARRYIQQATRLAPNSADVLASRAELLISQKAYDEAIDAYREIVRQQPEGDMSEVHFGLGLSYFNAESRNLALAAKELQTALRKKPDHVNGMRLLGQVYSDMGRHNQAVRYFEEAAKLNPADESTRLLLAESLAQDNQIAAALTALAGLVDERPESLYAKNNRAFFLAEFGSKTDLAEALELAQEAYEKQPTNPDFQDTLGWVKYKLGEKEEARSLIGLAVIRSKQAHPYYHMAVIAEESGEPAVAREHVEEAIRRVNELAGIGFVDRALRQNTLVLAKRVGANRNPKPRSQE